MICFWVMVVLISGLRSEVRVNGIDFEGAESVGRILRSLNVVRGGGSLVIELDGKRQLRLLDSSVNIADVSKYRVAAGRVWRNGVLISREVLFADVRRMKDLGTNAGVERVVFSIDFDDGVSGKVGLRYLKDLVDAGVDDLLMRRVESLAEREARLKEEKKDPPAGPR